MRVQVLADLLEMLLDRQRQIRLSPLTQRGHRFRLRQFLRWLESEKDVRTPECLQRRHLDAWLAYLNARQTWRKTPLRASSVNSYLGSVRVFLEYLAENGYIPHALATALPYVKTPNLLPTSVLTHAQVRKLLDRLPTDTPRRYRNRTMIEILYSSGLRASELLGLRLQDIDYAHTTLTVTGKGNKQRVVPIGRTALRFLETYIKAVRPYFLANRNETAVFLNRFGEKPSYHTLQGIIRYHVQHLSPAILVTAHTFRRSCATELLRGGANVYHVKDLMGHESLETMRHYARLTVVDLKKTHEKCHPRERDE